MIDIENKTYCPSLEEIGAYVHNLAFLMFCMEIKENIGATRR